MSTTKLSGDQVLQAIYNEDTNTMRIEVIGTSTNTIIFIVIAVELLGVLLTMWFK